MGGGTAPIVQVPTAEGLQYKMDDSKVHYAMEENKLHYSAKEGEGS